MRKKKRTAAAVVLSAVIPVGAWLAVIHLAVIVVESTTKLVEIAVELLSRS